jgi:tetratricopeptide (TPR) repeat protein
VKFIKTLFGGGPEKLEDKGDEFRLDFEYRDSAYYYQQALDSLPKGDEESAERLRRKLREVRRKAVSQFLEEASDMLHAREFTLAHERLETALGFADDESARAEVETRIAELEELSPRDRAPEPGPEEVAAAEGDLFDLALSGYSAEDRETAVALGEPFRRAYEACIQERWEEGLGGLDAILAENPGVPLVLELAGLISEQSDDPARALTYLEASYRAGPPRPATVTSLVSLYRRAGRHPEARNILSQAAAHRPIQPGLSESWAEVHLEHGMALAEDGHLEPAVSVLVNLLDVKNADRAFVYFNLAGILERMGREEDCRQALEQAIASSPRRPLYKERLSDFLVKRGIELDNALSLLVEANEVETTARPGMLGGERTRVTQSPHRGRYLYKMARIYFLKGEDLEAERTLTTALAVTRDPEVVRAAEELRQELKAAREVDP